MWGEKMIIVLDTNFVIYCAKYNLFFQLEENYPHARFFALDNVLFELEKIRDKKFRVSKKDIIAANIALEYLEIKKNKGILNVIKIKDQHDVDLMILTLAKELQEKDKNLFVATNDLGLSKKLKLDKIKIIKIRQKKYLIED